MQRQTASPLARALGLGLAALVPLLGPLAASADGPIGQDFQQLLAVPPGGYADVIVEVDRHRLLLLLQGDGSTNLDLVLYSEELGVLAISHAPGDRERIEQAFSTPKVVHALVINWGRSTNWCVLQAS